jgi:hypothetical protein
MSDVGAVFLIFVIVAVALTAIKALVGLAANLPPAPGTDLEAHLAKLKTAGPQPAPPAA